MTFHNKNDFRKNAMLDAAEILNARILIVDDQDANVKLLEQMLRNAGYLDLTSTMDPSEVCAMHQAHRYDLILLDLQMPEMDGFEVMEGLKKIEAGGYLPVLVITAQPGHKLRALQAGAKDFVSKPFDLVEVKTRIHNMLEVRLLYRKLDNYNKVLEQTVQERTAELRASEARFKSFTELSTDWYWEQDAAGKFTSISGPVFEMLGVEADSMLNMDGATASGWNVEERAQLAANIAARQPFLDFVYSRAKTDGTIQYLQVSGEPMFDSASRFIGYRGIGTDVSSHIDLRRSRDAA
jgi:PAS domain S-box-containing protein